MKRYLLLLSLVVATSCGEVRSRDTTLSIVGGTAAVDGEYPSVFLWTTADLELEDSYCTATKVGPNFILTAAHCVLDQVLVNEEISRVGEWNYTPTMADGERLIYSFVRDLAHSKDQHFLTIDTVLLPPALKECLHQRQDGRGQCMHGRLPIPDVALIKVSHPGGPFDQAPSSQLHAEWINANQKFTMLGYGAQDEADRDQGRLALRFHRSRVAGQTSLDQALEGTEADTDGKPDPKNFFGALGAAYGSRYANLGSGDSGGPVFIDYKTPLVAGINSDGYCPKDNFRCEHATNSFFMRIHKGPPYFIGEWLARNLE